jgi:hypothetical protein
MAEAISCTSNKWSKQGGAHAFRVELKMTL